MNKINYKILHFGLLNKVWSGPLGVLDRLVFTDERVLNRFTFGDRLGLDIITGLHPRGLIINRIKDEKD